MRMLSKEFCNFQVKARIINQDNNICVPVYDIFFADLHVSKNCTKMHQHRNEPHIGQFLVVFDTCSSDGLHQVATKETKRSMFVFFLDRFHQVRSMQIT